MSNEVALGVDIGGTNTAFGLIDRKGRIVFETLIKTREYAEPEDLIKEIHTKIAAFLEADNSLELKSIGIGAPNGNYYRGTVEQAPNLTWDGIVNLVDIFNNFFALPVFVTNDANAATIGEMYYGVARGMKDFCMVTLGTGVGSGFVAHENLIYGKHAFAGEIGHIIIEPEGRLCGCGRKGCLEAYCSAPGVTQTAREILAKSDAPSLLRGLNGQLDGESITAAAEKGDELALEVFDATAKYLGFSLANVVAITDPEAIILFGGLAKSGDLLLKPTRDYMNSYLLPIFQNNVVVQVSALLKRNAAILGAGALAWEELENE